MTPEQCAYIAGLIDGEGCITVYYTHSNYKDKHYKYVYYRLDVVVSTSHEFVKQVQLFIPYKTYITSRNHTKYNPNANIAYALQMSSVKEHIMPFIAEIEKYIILKSKQLSYLKLIINGYDKEINMNKIKELNKRGYIPT